MENQQEYPISDLSFLFPDLAPEEYDRPVSSIRQEGLLDPITVWQGEVIDGRHRLAACAEAGVEPSYRHLPDDADPVQYVLAINAFRRHLDESQRAVVAHLEHFISAFYIRQGHWQNRPATNIITSTEEWTA